MPTRRSPRTKPRAFRAQDGVTLIELVLSIAIIGVALGGTLGVIARTTVGSADPMLSEQALAVGEAYLEEIIAKPFFDPDLGAGGGTCPAPEGSRTLFDNVCDYAGLDDMGARDQLNSAIAALANYRVRVSVDTADSLGALTGADKVVRVDVRVTHTTLVDQTLSGYRTSF